MVSDTIVKMLADLQNNSYQQPNFLQPGETQFRGNQANEFTIHLIDSKNEDLIPSTAAEQQEVVNQAQCTNSVQLINILPDENFTC